MTSLVGTIWIEGDRLGDMLDLLGDMLEVMLGDMLDILEDRLGDIIDMLEDMLEVILDILGFMLDRLDRLEDIFLRSPSIFGILWISLTSWTSPFSSTKTTEGTEVIGNFLPISVSL